MFQQQHAGRGIRLMASGPPHMCIRQRCLVACSSSCLVSCRRWYCCPIPPQTSPATSTPPSCACRTPASPRPPPSSTCTWPPVSAPPTVGAARQPVSVSVVHSYIRLHEPKVQVLLLFSIQADCAWDRAANGDGHIAQHSVADTVMALGVCCCAPNPQASAAPRRWPLCWETSTSRGTPLSGCGPQPRTGSRWGRTSFTQNISCLSPSPRSPGQVIRLRVRQRCVSCVSCAHAFKRHVGQALCPFATAPCRHVCTQ